MHASVERRSDPRFTAMEHEPPRESLSHKGRILGPLEPKVSCGDGWRLVDVLLTGGAPWGFSLKGGLEYHEPLIITKVEEGSQAWVVRLQVGDEVVAVNEYPLTGYRQEAIGLVKGSHKTLALGVRRRTEAVNRPHSWHSIKFAEAQSEASKRRTTDSVVSQSQYDASLSSEDFSRGWDHTNLRRISNQFSSLGSMDSLEHCPPPCPTGAALSQAKPSGSAEYLGGAKRDSAYSSFSTGSYTPDRSLSGSNAASSENVEYKAGPPWDSRSWQQSLDEKQGSVGHGEGRDSPRHHPGSAVGGRASFGPVWHVPDKKRAADPSPPPPPLPVRGDSFAVTRVHEKASVVPYGEGPDPYAEQRPPGQGRGAVRAPDGASRGQQADDRGPGVRWSYNPAPRNDEHFLPPHGSGYGSQASSHSSVEFPSGHAPRQQQQYNDESTVYPQPRVAVPTMPPDTGGYYSIAQELPADSLPQPSGHACTSTTGTLDPEPCADYYCVTAAHRPPPREEDRKGGDGGVEVTRGANETDQNSKSHQENHRLSHPLPQRRYPNDQDNYYGKQKSQPLEQLVAKPNGNERRSQGRDNGYHAESHYVNYPLSKHESEEGQTSLPIQSTPDVWLSQEAVHSQNNVGPVAGSLQEPRPPNLQTGPPLTGNERFATILRNEIQNRRVRLQKSQSTAALTGSSQAEEEEKGPEVSTETSASSSDGSFSSSYKDHLKEVQARVLQATSFRRRDLEPEAPPSASTPTLVLYPEAPPPPGAVVSRIGGRKRFPPEKKALSVSEPNKIHEVGLAGAEPALEPSPPEHTGSLADRRKVFELTGKPVFQKPFLKQAKQGFPDNPRGGRTKGGAGRINTSRGRPEGQRASLGQQQCTFAEYDPAWDVQRKHSEAKPAGRCHSADSILDPTVDDWNRTSYIHERSRSSPSAELYGQNIPDSGRTSAEFFCPEREPAGHEGAAPRVSEQQQGFLGGRPSSSQLERFSEPPPEGAPHDDPESRGRAAVLPPDHGYLHRLGDKPLPRNPEAPPPYRQSQSRGFAPGEAGPAALRAGRRRRSEGVPSPSSSSSSSRTDPGPQENRRATLGSSTREPSPAPCSSSSSCDPPRQLRPSMDGLRPPCPQLLPQRPGDQLPASTRHDAPCSGMESLSENSGSSRAHKKGPIPVPVQITQKTESGPPLDPAQEPRLFSREQRRAEGQDGACPPGAPLEAPPPQPASTNGISPEEEQKRVELARDIVGRDRSLADILDRSGMRTTMDLMEGIFPEGGVLLEGAQQQRPKPAPQQTAKGPRGSPERREEDNMAPAVGLVTSSSYYFTSAPKAELLNKMKDMPGSDSEDELDLDLACKKHQLIDSLTDKLQVLSEARESLLEDVRSNNALGEEVESSAAQVCRPNELDKFRMFVGDLDKVVSLLLSLSGRLARVENALDTLQEDSTPEEKRTLTEKRAVLIRQHEDAKELKENLDRRERLVSQILVGRLSEERLADFRHFVKMKAALIIEQRNLDDKIKLGEEQLKCLTDSLPPDQRPPF